MTRNLRRLAVLSTMAVMFALTVAPSVSAYSGQIICLTPATCASSQTLNLTGPGSSATATFELTSDAPGATSVNYYVCPQSAASCSTSSGSDNGWTWSFTPTTGTTGTGCLSKSCEGNGYGTPSSLSLTVNAPSIVTSTNGMESLTIWACSQSGNNVYCASILSEVASLTIDATVPQFGLGIGVATALGMLGLVLVKRRSSSISGMPNVSA